jgi:hypothetical protein
MLYKTWADRPRRFTQEGLYDESGERRVTIYTPR